MEATSLPVILIKAKEYGLQIGSISLVMHGYKVQILNIQLLFLQSFSFQYNVINTKTCLWICLFPVNQTFDWKYFKRGKLDLIFPHYLLANKPGKWFFLFYEWIGHVVLSCYDVEVSNFMEVNEIND